MNQYVPRRVFDRTGEVASRLAAAFGKRVAFRRMELGMTQDQMIQRVNHRTGMELGRSTASVWENGHAEPSISTILAIARVLDVEPEYLAFGVNPPPANPSTVKAIVPVASGFKSYAVPPRYMPRKFRTTSRTGA